MPKWYRKDVGDGVEALGPTAKLHDAFLALAKSGGVPTDSAVFSRYDLRKNVVTWWFTPEASQVAKAFGASACEKPSPTDLVFSVGDAHAWKAHFPDHIPSRRRE